MTNPRYLILTSDPCLTDKVINSSDCLKKSLQLVKLARKTDRYVYIYDTVESRRVTFEDIKNNGLYYWDLINVIFRW